MMQHTPITGVVTDMSQSFHTVAGDVAGAAKAAVSKLGKSLSQAVGALVPKDQEESRPPPRAPQRGYGRSEGDYGQLNPWYDVMPRSGHASCTACRPCLEKAQLCWRGMEGVHPLTGAEVPTV